MEKPPIIFLCGEAGVGKTTIIQRALAKIELRPGGFTTDEIRDKGRRIGFEIKTLSGEKGMLAHVDFRSRFWVGKYYVNIKDLDKFRRFVRLCAGRVGQLFIASHLANELGVSVHTINSWLSILKTSYIVFQLPPFHANINKRLIKAHKLFFYDIGLASNLLRIQQPDLLENHPLRGALFENLVIADIVKSRRHKSLMDNFFFYRDSNQNEVDLVIDDLQTLDAVEVKSSETFSTSLLKGLNHFRKVFPEKARRTILCTAARQEMLFKEHQLVHFMNISELITQE